MPAWLSPITILLVLTSGLTKFPQNIGMKHPCDMAAILHLYDVWV